MSETPSPHSEPIEAIEAIDRKLPIWGPELVVATAIVIDVILPSKLTVGPSWLLPTLEGVLLVGLIVASPHPYVRHSPARRRVAIALIALVSATNAVSLGLLSHFLLKGGMENGRTLIFSGALLWLTNVLLFGLWYWELDSGGPMRGCSRAGLTPTSCSCRCPTPGGRRRAGGPGWSTTCMCRSPTRPRSARPTRCR